MPSSIRTDFLVGLVLVVGVSAAAAPPPDTARHGDYPLPSVRHQGRAISFETMIASLASARAVVVGESHDRFDHHLNQLEIIERLHGRQPRLAIGMEQFQQSAQRYLDDYISGELDTEAMLIGTNYYQRWRFDYRLYQPVLSFARRHGVPVVALNLPAALTRKVAAEGLAALTDDERARLPRLDRSNDQYRQRLRETYREHPMRAHGGDFEDFYTAQLLWDEAMAARAAEYLSDNPGHVMVILAGNGHVEFGSGIPDRLARRIDGEVSTVVNADRADDQAARADYLLTSSPVALPERGMLGVMIDRQADGARVNELSDDSAAGAVGVKPGDVIVALDGQSVNSLADLRARMWDKRPGDRVSVSVRRDSDQPLRFDVTLR